MNSASDDRRRAMDVRSARVRAEIARYRDAADMTDDERAAHFGLPRGCRMRERAKILAQENLTIGEYVWIGEGAILDATGGLTIGAHTSIGLNVLVWTHSTMLANLAMDNAIGSPYAIRKATSIGFGCFIGGPSVIYPGVTIGDRVVVMPMSVITADVPSASIVAGNPASVTAKLTDRYIMSLFQLHGMQPPPAALPGPHPNAPEDPSS